ncbi:MAG: hypothetical protein WBW81_06510 [Methylocella sp.]
MYKLLMYNAGGNGGGSDVAMSVYRLSDFERFSESIRRGKPIAVQFEFLLMTDTVEKLGK